MKDNVLETGCGDAGMGHDMMIRRLLEEIDAVLRALPPDEEEVLRLRYGIGGPILNHGDVGRFVGATVARVRTIESHALQRLRQGAVASRSMKPVLLPPDVVVWDEA